MARKHRMHRTKKSSMPKPMGIVSAFSKTFKSSGKAFKKEFKSELGSAVKSANFGKRKKRN